ncbi:MAG: CvpA family protein [Chloroflexi bacterium]|nr:CvpA family protein [Chloroflexota bacterium]
MNWVDVVIAILLIAGAAVGFIQGLLRLLFASAAMYVAFILAAQYFHVVGIWLGGFFSSASAVALDSVAFSVVFVASQVGVNGLGRSAYKNTRLGRIGALDQLAGSLIGLVLGFALVCIAVTVLNFAVRVPWPGLEMVRRSITDTAATSSLMPMFLAAIPSIVETVKPWLPAPLPAIFFL